MKRKMPDDEVDAIIRMRYGKLPQTRFETAYVSYSKLAKILKVSRSHIRSIVLKRIDELSRSSLEDMIH